MTDRLPNAELARIDSRKLRDYVLNPRHDTGRYKAAFFAQMGYSAENWQQLRRDILEQHLSQPAAPGNPSQFGRKYTITAQLQGPKNAARWVTTVWIIRTGNDWPELITIEPATQRKVSNHE